MFYRLDATLDLIVREAITNDPKLSLGDPYSKLQRVANSFRL